MNIIGAILLALLSLTIMTYLGRWAARPTVHQLMIWRGNKVAQDNWRPRWEQAMLERARQENSR